MELRDYFRVIRKRWRIIVVAVLVAVAAAAGATALSPKIYQAQTQLFVSTSGGNDASALLQGSSFTQQRVQSYADLITTPAVLGPVIDKLQLTTTPEKLAAHITATVPLNTVIIHVAVTDQSPEQAAQVADAVGRQFTTTVADLESVSDSSPSPVKVSIVSAPSTPTAPVSPRPVRNIALGLVLGLLLGFGLALLRDLLDTTVKGEADLPEVTDAPVVGGIPFEDDAAKRPLVVQAMPHGLRAEGFRTLRTNLQFVDATTHPRSIVVTSSIAGEGKSTMAANLAMTMAAAGSRVCLIEADLRRPKLLDYMGLDGAVGLTDVLIGQIEVKAALQHFGEGDLWVLGSGPIPPNPSELLGSGLMQRALRELEARFDIVLIDAPPLLPVTDAAVLSTVAGGTVLVVGVGMVDRAHLTKALQSLESVKANLLGLVLNRIPTKGADAYHYYEGYASQTPRERAKERAKDEARSERSSSRKRLALRNS